MEELRELKQKIIDRHWEEAIAIVEEMEEMSRDDKRDFSLHPIFIHQINLDRLLEPLDASDVDVLQIEQ
jgi:hypothetical protein